MRYIHLEGTVSVIAVEFIHIPARNPVVQGGGIEAAANPVYDSCTSGPERWEPVPVRAHRCRCAERRP